MALQVRKLTPEESSRLFPKRGQIDLAEYTSALNRLQPGDAAEVRLGSLSARALKRRLGQAAKQMGQSLRWSKEESPDALRFQVREASRGGRRGRRRKAE